MNDKVMSVDELRSLIQGGQTEAGGPPPGPVAAPVATASDLAAMTAKKERPSVSEIGIDALKAAGAGMARGAVGLTGLPGDVETLGRMGARYAGFDVSPEATLPTSSRMIAGASKNIPGAKDVLEYAPQHGLGRYAKTAGEFLPGALIGPGGLGAKVAGSIGAGAATQGVEDWLKGTQYQNSPTEMGLKIVASIPGYMVGSRVAGALDNVTSGVLTPGREAKSRIADALKQDATGAGKYGNLMRPEDIAATGADTTLGAVGGPKTQKLMQNAAYLASDEAKKSYNATAARLAGEAPENASTFIDKVFGEPVNALSKVDDIRNAARAPNSAAYDAAYADPNAYRMWDNTLASVLNRSGVQRVNETLKVLRERGISPVDVGFVKNGNKYNVGPDGLSLQFWDQLKKTTGDKIDNLVDTNGVIRDRNLYSAMIKTKEDLTSHLRSKVDLYGKALDTSGEALGKQSAIMKGYEYFDQKKPTDLMQTDKFFSGLNDDQKKEFARGLIGRLKAEVMIKPHIVRDFVGSKNATLNAKKLEAVLGKQKANELLGYLTVQSLNRTAQPIADISGSAKLMANPATAGAMTGAVALGESLLQGALFSGSGSALVAAMAGVAGKGLLNVKERRIADRIMALAEDPNAVAKIGQLVRTDPAAQSFLRKAQNFAESKAKYIAGPSTSMDESRPLTITPNRPQRRSGGRVASHEFQADRLIAAAEKAKRQIGKQTQSILEKPDEIVVKALQIANQNLEG